MNLFERIGYALFNNITKEESVLKEIEELQESNDSTFKFFKDKETDQLRWLAAWTSNYLDDDNPPDIISEKSHKDFVGRVERGEVPYPELWHWHTEKTRWGVADWIAYDDEFGIMWASGLVDKGHEKEALELLKSKIEIGVSHGMKDIIRNPDDTKVVAHYTTYEISDLPLWWAANKMTALFIAEKNKNDMEVNMALPEKKKEYLRAVGLSEEDIQGIEEYNKERAEKFADRARKEVGEDEKPVDAEVEESKDSSEEVESKDDNADLESEKAEGDNGEETEKSEETNSEETEKENEFLTAEMVKEIIKAGFSDFGEGVVGALERIENRLNSVEEKQKEIEKRQKAEKELEPLSKSLMDRFSAIGSKQAEISEDDELTQNPPHETKEDKERLGEYSSASELLADVFSRMK